MNNFSKTSLIKANKEANDNAKSLKDPVGILALFHSKDWSGGTQRMIIERSDLLEIHKSTGDSRNDALGRIDYQIRKSNDLGSNQDLALAIINYLPHTQTWKQAEQFSGMMHDDGFLINFDVDKVGITTRQVMTIDFETWKEVSTDEQINHQTNSSKMGEYLKAIPTEMVLTPAQKQERLNKMNRSNGLKQFFYGKEYVWAMNKKNADKKAKKLGLK
jgi:hypothetical protein